MDADGRFVATAELGNWPNLKFSDRDSFRAQQNSNTNPLIVGKPIQTVLLGRTVIPLSRRLNKSDGTFAVVIIQIARSRLTEIYKSTRLLWRGFISVIRLDGIVKGRRTGAGESAGEDYSGALGIVLVCRSWLKASFGKLIFGKVWLLHCPRLPVQPASFRGPVRRLVKGNLRRIPRQLLLEPIKCSACQAPTMEGGVVARAAR